MVQPSSGFAGDVTVSKTEEIYKVAMVQTHNSYEGRQEVLKEITLERIQRRS